MCRPFDLEMISLSLGFKKKFQKITSKGKSFIERGQRPKRKTSEPKRTIKTKTEEKPMMPIVITPTTQKEDQTDLGTQP